MSNSVAISLALASVPVLLFLIALRWMDRYRLVPTRLVVEVILAGAGAAVLCFIFSSTLQRVLPGFDPLVSRWLLPMVEELAKAGVVLLLFRSHRIGFLVDAAILGFAVGAGFAITENLYYVSAAPEWPLGVWLVRGFGTAIMHGGVTAMFAVLTQLLSERGQRLRLRNLWAPLIPVLALHWAFNQFYFSPLVHTVVVVTCIPALLTLVFIKSTQSMRQWLQLDFDNDVALISQIRAGEFTDTRMGNYLLDLRQRFDGAATADMLCYLRLQTELSMRAKGVLMMREHGFDTGLGADAAELLAEMRYLEQSLGPVGLLAIAPFVQRNARTRWQQQLVKRLS